MDGWWVTVLFPKVYDGKPLGELAETVRQAVTTEFKQKSDNIELDFAIGNGSSPAAQLRDADKVQHAAL
ncbi:MAG: hypothetical protein WBD90_22040 [Xanthobacteraceae bacterium]|jgi:hypothetical protein